jgi:hypothetical protein
VQVDRFIGVGAFVCVRVCARAFVYVCDLISWAYLRRGKRLQSLDQAPCVRERVSVCM